MDAIVLLSHGSVLCGSERNLLDLAAGLRAGGAAPIVEAGFLNYTDPPFAEAVERCIAQGATRIVVAPYFLIPGKFVVSDLPAAIAAVPPAHPNLQIRTAEVIGFHPIMAEAILASAREPRSPESWLETLRDSAEWCRENPKCPLYGSQFCRASAEAMS